MLYPFQLLLPVALLLATACNGQPKTHPALTPSGISVTQLPITCGAERIDELYPMLRGKAVALMVNQTATCGGQHLVDTLHTLGVDIRAIFAPEHGFRGGADAGEDIVNSTDRKTGIPIVSVYGAKKKPTADDLKDVDVVIFDIQDVGARFYTFISSLHYLMDACVENNKELIVLDRPNPNGWYVDGPVLKKEFSSFVGVDPIPVVHGLTVGEYAQMVNGEKWLAEGKTCALQVVSCLNYDHTMRYNLPVKPSPNLPNAQAVYLYPSICYFEGTDVSVGRGTAMPFQVIGAPKSGVKDFSFTPQSMQGATNPPHLGKACFGLNLQQVPTDKPGIQLSYLLQMYSAYTDKPNFFLPNNFIDKLAGTDELRKQIIAGKTEDEIRQSWQPALNAYKQMRKKYLLYPDFEEED